MRAIPAILSVLALLDLPVATQAAAEVVFESWAISLPPNECLPATTPRVVFSGPFCDGISCPPGEIVVAECGAIQDGFALALGGARRSVRTFCDSEDTPAHARVADAGGQLEFSGEGPSAMGLEVEFSRAAVDWDLDLVARGVSAFRFSVTGALSPSQPLIAYFVLRSQNGPAGAPFADLTRTLDSPGDPTFALSDFTTHDGFDFSDTESISLVLSDCDAESCPGPYAPRAIAMGPLRVVADAVNKRPPSSWGQLKIRAR